MMQLVSVIMSCHNNERYINKSIDSILNQSHRNIELIVIDDASTDNTLSILFSYEKSDARVRVFSNQENLGLTKSLNKLIKYVKGDYIARHDADDYSDSNRISLQLQYMQNSFSQVLGTFCYLIDDEGTELTIKKKPTNCDAINKTLILKNCLIHGSVLIDYNKVGDDYYYDENYLYSQDYELWSRLSRKYKINNLDLPLYYLRAHSNSITSVNNFKQLNYAAKVALNNTKNSSQPFYNLSIFLVYVYYVVQTVKSYIRLMVLYFRGAF